jgi:linoleoyl-CoA desaturase
MHYKDLSFPTKAPQDFFVTVQTRVRKYFEDNKISRYGDIRMVIKTIVMMLIYFGPYFLMLSGVITSSWQQLILWAIMGVGMAGLGLSVMHDANHGAYSKNRFVNKFLGYVIHILGGSATNWILQHNVLHHTFTNVDGVDEDINPGNFLRFSPHQKRTKMHELQHIYAWPLYALMTILWITTKDFKQIIRYKKSGLIKQMRKPYSVLFTEILTMKVFYYVYALIIPLIFFAAPWYLTIVFFLLMHFIAGLTLAAIFQSAHVMPTSEYPLPDDKGKLENHWAIHQMLTTANFSPKSRILSWYVGGLNFQIEHHLFPNICHVHYKSISKIVEKTAKEFGLPYHSQPNFFIALKEHARMLYRLGHYDKTVVA